MRNFSKKPIIALDARLVQRNNTGDSAYWLGLLTGLSQLNLDVQFLLFSNASAPHLIPRLENFKWVELPTKSERWWSLISFPLIARRLGAQVIHTQYNLSPLAKAMGITTVHDVSFFVGPEWFLPKDRFLLQWQVPASCRRARKVITVSETSSRDIKKYIPSAKAKIQVTPEAVPIGIEPIEQAEAKRIVQDELKIDFPFMLTVGTRWPRKNMELAIESSRLISPDIAHKLVLTGKQGWGKEHLHPKVHPTGYVTQRQLCALYSASDLYLAPSYYEGFGLTILEAFHCGCPVVCSTGGAQPEVAGDGAWVEKSWTAEEWSGQIESLLTDSSKLTELRQKGLERAKAFSWKHTGELTWQVYQEVLCNG